MKKRAIELEPGDRCCGPYPFADHGVVETTVVVDQGVQVNWQGGTHTIRAEDYEFRLEVRGAR